MSAEEPSYLFVYGTLRKGVNNQVKEEIINDVEWIGETEIPGRMYDIGRYPGAVPLTNNERGVIRGEIIKIMYPERVFKLLDHYEGYNPEELDRSEYYRAKEKINLEDGQEIDAWVYWYNFSVDGKKRIESSDYLDYLKNKR
jgi:gamma-glutamylcyclotransferase (GGCT)/AIG2-like uncharacterized protein YtfP